MGEGSIFLFDSLTVRIRHSKIGELAHQAQSERIFAEGEIPGGFKRSLALQYSAQNPGRNIRALREIPGGFKRSLALQYSAQNPGCNIRAVRESYPYHNFFLISDKRLKNTVVCDIISISL